MLTEQCPHCGSVNFANIFLRDMGDYAASLQIPCIGQAYLVACVDCGTVYLPASIHKEVKKKYINGG